MKLYEIVKENGVSVFQEAESLKDLGDFLNMYRLQNFSEEITVYIVDENTLKRKRKSKSYTKIKDATAFLNSLMTEKKVSVPKVKIIKSPADLLDAFEEILRSMEKR